MPKKINVLENNVFDASDFQARDKLAVSIHQEPFLRQTTPVWDLPAGHQNKNFNPDDIIAKLHFPDNMSPKSAAWLLDHVNAVAVAPINSQVYDPDEFFKGYNFFVRLNEFKEFIHQTFSTDDVLQNDGLAQFYKEMMDNTQKIKATPTNPEMSENFWEIRKFCVEFTEHSFNTTNDIRDYVNFLYSWASDNIRNQEMTDAQQKSEAIFKEYLLLQIKKVEQAKSKSEKTKLIKHIIASVVFDDRSMAHKINQFNGIIGKLKTTTPPSLPVILDNGERADFFKLDKNKYYRVMNYIDVSKTKMPFDFSNIDINSNFECANARAKIIFPRRINGFIDCSSTDINLLSIDKIPNGTTYIDFSATVKDFADLLNIKFPKSVHEIRLSRSLLNSVAKDTKKMQQIRQFQDKNPNIEIWDSKHALSLRDILTSALNQIEQKKASQRTVQPVVTESKTNMSLKTEQWLSRKEIVALCRQDTQFSEIDADIEKLVKQAIKTNNQIKSGSKSCDGKSVMCMHVDSVDLLKQTILQIYQDNTVRETPKVVKDIPNTKPTVTKAKKARQTIKIEKYIPKQVWKNICNACGNSLNLLYSVLERISMINTDYTKLPSDKPLQHIDKMGNMQSIPNTCCKRGNGAAIQIENTDNRRVVITMNKTEKILVVIAFFSDHVDNAQTIRLYNQVALPNAAKGQNMDGVTIDKNFVEQSEYLKVSELLQTYGQKIADRQKQPTKKPDQSCTKRPRITHPTPQPKTLVDVKSLDIQIENFIMHLDTEIKRLANDTIRNCDDAARQLRNIEEMKKLLQEKISLQKKM